jgi:hypothetical protein
MRKDKSKEAETKVSEPKKFPTANNGLPAASLNYHPNSRAAHAKIILPVFLARLQKPPTFYRLNNTKTQERQKPRGILTEPASTAAAKLIKEADPRRRSS